jgi:signal transduction histidine kinase
MNSQMLQPTSRAQLSGVVLAGLSSPTRSITGTTKAGRVSRGRVLLVEDERIVREALQIVLEAEGYDVALAENGYDALTQLRVEALPDIILFDLIMPVMDGWQFRAIQKNDPRLTAIPVVALSGDRSSKAAAISAHAYLRKPIEPSELLETFDRLLVDNERHQMSNRLIESERLASLGRLAAAVGHEINNPLAFVMMNLSQSIEELRAPNRPQGCPELPPSQVAEELQALRTRLVGVTDMLEDCLIGGERMRVTVGNLQRLSRQGKPERVPLDVNKLIDESISIVWNQIRHRARLIKTYGVLPQLRGNSAAIGQVFLNLLVNAAQAIPEGEGEKHEIRISTRVEGSDDVPGGPGAEAVIEIRDTGRGMGPEVVGHVFEPFFTTKPMGQGTGLGLSISRETISEHHGRITVESTVGTGTAFRIYLPVRDPLEDQRSGRVAPPWSATSDRLGQSRGRVLVVDDEMLLGRSIKNALSDEHDTLVVERASEALGRLDRGEIFDLILCDVVMPDLGGAEFYQTVTTRWPEAAPRIVFMTGGAFTPETVAFMEHLPNRVLYKPFKLDSLKTLIRERMKMIAGNA